MPETHTKDFNPPWRTSHHPTQPMPPLKPAPPLQYEKSTLRDGKTLLEKDLTIPMRDGVKIYADVFRPADESIRSPSIVLFAPFGKHGATPVDLMSNMGVDFSTMSEHTHWELPDPLRWCGEWGYALVIVDPRGTWWSEGDGACFLSPEEGRDGYDVVEWTAQQSWSNGSVGWGAVSYYAMSAYQTAVLRPPHLKALLIWEGISDVYREVNGQGGIPCVPLQQFWMILTGNGLGKSEDHGALMLEHPLFDELWQSKVADWTRIDIPTWSIKAPITGHASLKVWIQAMDFPDTDLFVAVEKIDAAGAVVDFWSSTQDADAPAALGWLRISHRALDEDKSRPELPVHTHSARQWLRQSDIVEANVELWPSATIWDKGETLRLVLQGRPYGGNAAAARRRAPSHSVGKVNVWFGGRFDSHLLLPVMRDVAQK